MANQITSPRQQGATQNNTPADIITVNHYEINDLLANLKSVENGVSNAVTALRLAENTDNSTHLQSLIEVVIDSLGSQLAVMQWELDRLASQTHQGGRA